MKRYLLSILLGAAICALTSGCGGKNNGSASSEAAISASSLPDTEAVEITADSAPVPLPDSDPEILESEEPQAEEIVIGTAQ